MGFPFSDRILDCSAVEICFAFVFVFSRQNRSLALVVSVQRDSQVSDVRQKFPHAAVPLVRMGPPVQTQRVDFDVSVLTDIQVRYS